MEFAIPGRNHSWQNLRMSTILVAFADKKSTMGLHPETTTAPSPLRHSRLRGQELSEPGAAPKAGYGGLPAGDRGTESDLS